MLLNRGNAASVTIVVPFSKFNISEGAKCCVGDVWNTTIETMKSNVTRYTYLAH